MGPRITGNKDPRITGNKGQRSLVGSDRLLNRHGAVEGGLNVEENVLVGREENCGDVCRRYKVYILERGSFGDEKVDYGSSVEINEVEEAEP